MSKSVAHLDLHAIAKNSQTIETVLQTAIAESRDKKIKILEIITGKGTGQLMKRVKKFLNQKSIQSRYKRVSIDANNHGRLFVYFR